MKNLIENVIQVKHIELDMQQFWTEALKIKDKIVEAVKKLAKGQVAQRLKQFWRKFRTHILVAGLALSLWGLGALPISIFIFLV